MILVTDRARAKWTPTKLLALRRHLGTKERPMSQQQIGTLVGVSLTSWSRWENGHSAPHSAIAEKITALAKKKGFKL
jgi:DNA-binding XRE family transcriptional regulator